MFDRYQQWLGISPGPRPPTHYLLLGISPAERDPAEIDESAQRRTAQLRAFLAGTDAHEASQLLQEIANARRVLVDPELRRAYDASLGNAAAGGYSPNFPEPVLATSNPAPAGPLTIPSPASSPHLCKPLLAIPDESLQAAVTRSVAAKQSSRSRNAITTDLSGSGSSKRLRPTWRLYAGIVFLPTAVIALLFLLRAGSGPEKELPKTESVTVKPSRPAAAKSKPVADKPKSSFVPLDLDGVTNAASTELLLADSQPLRLVLPKWGRQVYDGIPFEIRDPKGGAAKNVIALDRLLMVDRASAVPSIRVPCSASAKCIYLLAGAHRRKASPVEDKSVSLIVRLKYLDGPSEDHQLRYGVQLGDFAGSVRPPDARPAVTVGGIQLRYLKIVPADSQQMISFIDLIHGGNATTPVILAVTLEREPH